MKVIVMDTVTNQVDVVVEQIEAMQVKLFDMAALFGALKAKSKLVHIEGFGNLLVRGVSQQRNEELQERAKKKNIPSWKLVLVESIFTPDGSQRVFSESDIAALGECGEAAIQMLLDPVLILNNWKKDPDAKNSQTTQKDDSSSA
ncbi:hypothetical protein [Undibacterium curvum]|uniref:Uncharacterized protein n=1 Tax=Undibacterium curvum TaxID=2762294 RepID=A0ABR7A5N8_9BURK|nr:hypothetical protein [Undibacterium curvum]MBC3931977.1 hypothetical protein [Undibacterium curvum]